MAKKWEFVLSLVGWWWCEVCLVVPAARKLWQSCSIDNALLQRLNYVEVIFSQAIMRQDFAELINNEQTALSSELVGEGIGLLRIS